MNQQQIDEMFRASKAGVRAHKRQARRDHPIRWALESLLIVFLFIMFAAILMAAYTHPVQP